MDKVLALLLAGLAAMFVGLGFVVFSTVLLWTFAGWIIAGVGVFVALGAFAAGLGWLTVGNKFR